MNTLVRRDSEVRPSQIGRFGIHRAGIVRFILGMGLLAGAALGAMFTLAGRGPDSQGAPGIEGTWELTNLNGEPISGGSAVPVIWQRVSFRGGKVCGETLIPSGAAQGRVSLPFPDQSVDRVVTTPDDAGLRVMWSGTYQIDEHEQATMHIGKAVYFLKSKPMPGGQTMEFNLDVILMLPGTALYHRSLSSPAQMPRHDLELFPGAAR